MRQRTAKIVRKIARVLCEDPIEILRNFKRETRGISHREKGRVVKTLLIAISGAKNEKHEDTADISWNEVFEALDASNGVDVK